MTAIHHRMHRRMTPEDQKNIRQGLLNYCVRRDVQANELQMDNTFIKMLIPYFVELHDDFIGLKDDIQFEASTFHKHLFEYLKNQIRKKGKYLQPKIDVAKAALASNEDSDASASDEKEEDDGPQSQKAQYPIKKKKKDSPESTPQKDHAKPKLSKREQTPEEPTLTPQKTKDNLLDLTPVDLLTANEAFAKLNRLGCDIRSRKREIKMLHKHWLKLRDAIDAALADPLSDFE